MGYIKFVIPSFKIGCSSAVLLFIGKGAIWSSWLEKVIFSINTYKPPEKNGMSLSLIGAEIERSPPPSNLLRCGIGRSLRVKKYASLLKIWANYVWIFLFPDFVSSWKNNRIWNYFVPKRWTITCLYLVPIRTTILGVWSWSSIICTKGFTYILCLQSFLFNSYKTLYFTLIRKKYL